MGKQKEEKKKPLKPVEIISDSPEEESLLFGFDDYSRTIAGLIANKNNNPPFTIGIYGEWGSGKTTLMEGVINELKNNNDNLDTQEFRSCNEKQSPKAQAIPQ